MMVMMVFFMLLDLKSLFWMSLIVEYHHFSMWILVRVPAFNVSFFIRYFMSFQGVFVVARRVAKFIAILSMDSLRV